MHFDHTASPFRLTEPEIPPAMCCASFEVTNKKETPELKLTEILETNINSQKMIIEKIPIRKVYMLHMKGMDLVFLPYENIQAKVSVGGSNSETHDIEYRLHYQIWCFNVLFTF